MFLFQVVGPHMCIQKRDESSHLDKAGGFNSSFGTVNTWCPAFYDEKPFVILDCESEVVPKGFCMQGSQTEREHISKVAIDYANETYWNLLPDNEGVYKACRRKNDRVVIKFESPIYSR